jgi:hypothetical protein
MIRTLRVGVATVIFTILSTAATEAQAQNVALGRPIIDGSSAWNGVFPNAAPHTGGSFPTSRVTDGVTFEGAGAPETYWLGKEGGSPEYFTLDLQFERNLDEIRLFNTHNRASNDRGTDEFVLYAGNTIDAMNRITDEVPILAGNLSDVRGQENIVPNVFAAGTDFPSGIQARYLRFEALSAIPPIPDPPPNCCFSVGLNEIEVIDFGFVNPNLAAGKPIIDGSGSWEGGAVGVGAPFNGGQFPAHNVTDGAITEVGGNYWLGREGTANEHFTIDLEGVRHIEELRIFNTHNQASNDRGTRNFRVLAADALDGGNQLVNPEVIFEGRLPIMHTLNPSVGWVFTNDNGLTPTDARYIRLETQSAYYGANNVGINEVEVYSTEMHTPSPVLNPAANIAARKPVIHGSGAWNSEVQCDPASAFDAGGFPAGRVTDDIAVDLHSSAGTSTYWLGRENCSEEFFTLDLGEIYNIDEIDLFNSHNAQFNDRGTDEFIIYGSNQIDDLDNQLINPEVLLSANLQRSDSQAPIAPEKFTVANGLLPGAQARYIQFVALTYHSSAANGGAGLNEIEIYGTVIPEPSSWALATAAGFAAVVVARRRARRLHVK